MMRSSTFRFFMAIAGLIGGLGAAIFVCAQWIRGGIETTEQRLLVYGALACAFVLLVLSVETFGKFGIEAELEQSRQELERLRQKYMIQWVELIATKDTWEVSMESGQGGSAHTGTEELSRAWVRSGSQEETDFINTHTDNSGFSESYSVIRGQTMWRDRED